MADDTRRSVGPGRAPEFTTDHAAKYLKRGFDALMKRDFGDANGCASLVLKYMPQLAEAHFLVGLIGIETGDWRTAQKAFASVVHLKEDHAAAWAQLARVLVRTGDFNGAESAVAKANEHGSEDPLVLDVIGTVYTLMGDQETALKQFTAACEGKSSASFYHSKAQCLMYLGRFDEAREALQKVLELAPLDTSAHYTLARIAKAKNKQHINDMLGLLDKCKPMSPPTASLYYGLGKEYEDLEMWPEAFKSYEAGGKVRRANIQYNEQDEVEAFKALQKSLTTEWLESAGAGCEAQSPIFIIGQPRTGTTLVERIITARDDVHSAGELPQFGMNLKRMCNQKRPEGTSHSHMITAATAQTAATLDMKRLGETYMETTRSLRSDLPRFVDKLPLNYLYAPLIAAALPNAKIIHVTRDPLDACFASFKQLFAEAYYHSYEQREMARHHVRYHKLMEHYHSMLGDRLHVISYEDTVENMESEARKMIEFLELDWQNASLEFHKQASAVTTASAAQVREKTHSRSVGKWKRFEKELMPMQKILADAGLNIPVLRTQSHNRV
jgi:tetratricopeptide (TPR) repeat protein